MGVKCHWLHFLGLGTWAGGWTSPSPSHPLTHSMRSVYSL